MQTDFYLGLASALAGIGIGAALSRKSIISVIMSLITASAGAVIAMAALNKAAGGNEGMLFAVCLGAILLVLIVVGCALAYRRFMSSGHVNINEGNNLRH